MPIFWLKSWLTRRSAAPKPAAPRPRRLAFERLETREVPAGVAVWTHYTPRVGDRVDALIRHIAPVTRDGITFFKYLNGWISTTIAPRVPTTTNVNVMLTQLAGDCTVRAAIFQAVAQRLGFRVQIVVFSNVPYQGKHMAIEVAVRGRWHFFDPSSGIYLAYRRNLRLPFGLPQARSVYKMVIIMDCVAPLYGGSWSAQRTFAYRPATQNIATYLGRPAFNLRHTYFFAPMVQQGPLAIQ